jgi:hypothetical protein
VATTLTPDDELTRVAFADIAKWEEGPDGTLFVYGRASTPEVDTDDQVVSSAFSGEALKNWLADAPALRVQHQSQRDPAGSGVKVEVNRDGDGAHWVKAAVDEPIAQRLVRKGHLRAFSIGIAKPVIERDMTGKARGGIITGGRIVEVSLVDSPANRSCFLELAKADKTGAPEWSGKVYGADDLLTKVAHDGDTVNVDVPRNASITFSPTDLAKLLEARQVAEDREAAVLKAITDAEYPVYKRDIDTATRRRLASQGRALDNLSYPIETHEDADNAVTLALSGHGNVAAAKKLIRRIASKEGWQDILDRLDGKTSDSADKADGGKCSTCHGSGKIMDGNRDCPDCDGPAKDDAGKEVTPDLAKDDGEDEETDEGGSQSGGGALHHDDGQDDDTDSDADAMDKAAVASLCAKYGWTPEQFQVLPEQALAALVAAEKAASPDMTKPPKMPCPKCKKPNKAKAKFCAKCGASMMAEKASRPTPADHAEGAAESAIEPAPEHREPDGPVVESFEHDAGLPTVPDAGAMPMKVAAFHKAIGVPHTEGWLHDLTCPAFEPATAKAAHPLADLGMLDELAWQAKALDTAARAPLDQAREAALLWQHALTVKTTPPDVAGEILAEAHKAFRDANPGPGRAPVPGEIPASRFHRPYITDGHAAPSPGQDPPHRDPVHAGHVSASMYQRGPLESGHAEDSPGNMNPRHEPIGAPEVPGVPSRVYYSRMQRDNARQAMTAMHDHIARTFPDVCPMLGPGHMGQPGAGTRPVPVGVGGPVPHGASKATAGGDTTVTITAQGGAAADETAPITRITPKQLRRRLEKAVFAGEMTLDEAHAKLGIQPSAPEPVALKVATAPLVAAIDPEVIKAAVTEAIGPALAQRDAEHADELEKVRKELKGLRKVADAIADQPDPNVTAYRGVALMGPPATKAAAPAGGAMADRAERAQQTLFNAMYEQWRTASSPEDREIAFDAMKDMTGLKFTG